MKTDRFKYNKKPKNNKEYDYSMTALETIGALVVLVGGLLIYFGIQYLGSAVISPFGISFAYIGLGLIIAGIGLIYWFIKTRL